MTTAKLFQNGHTQAVRFPKGFRLPGSEVYIKLGNAIVLLPMDQPWDALWESLSHFSEDFMDAREQLPVQPRDDAFTS